MKVADIMTKNLIVVEPATTVGEAARLMLDNRISGLPVVSGGKLVGIVTEGDFLRRAETGTERRRRPWLAFLLGPGRLADEYVRTHARRVEEVMTRDPVTVDEETALEEVVSTMEKKNIKRVPIVSGDRLVGLVTRANMLNALASLSRDAKPSNASDGAIRDQILAAVEKQPWAPVGFNVVVREGVAEVSGVITDDRARGAIIVTAENVAGVKAVHDHITWVEPISGAFLYSGEDQAAADAKEAAKTKH
jgi:CBS domain-containing protein